MSARDDALTRAEIEPERYELFAGPSYRFEIPRRDFLKTVGAGLVVVLLLRDDEALALQESGRRGGGRGGSLPPDVAAWLHVGADGTITVHTGKAEVGQDIRTSLSQAVADEIRAPIESIRMVMGDTALVPYDMGTFGSRTTPSMSSYLRSVAAAAREAMIDLAAARLEADRAGLVAENGRVADAKTNRSLGYGEITRGEKIVKTIEDAPDATAPENWTIAGKPARKVNGRAIVTGAEPFVADVKRDGLLVGKILRPPVAGAALVSADTSGVAAMPGVTVVRDGDFVGVAAPDEPLAEKAILTIRAEWKTESGADSRGLFEWLKKNADDSRGRGGFGGSSRREEGSVEKGLAEADLRFENAYTVATIAHVPLEPRAAVAEWEGEKLTVWTGTQRPFGVRSELSSAFSIPDESVRVILPATGSGYGGKHTGEAAIEAARLARAAKKPVRVAWTRAEEFAFAYFRPAALIEVKCGVKKDGTITAWEYVNWNSGSSAIETPYDVANASVRFQPTKNPVRQGSYRALAATANHFARETQMNEMARAIGADPYDFRMKNTRDARLTGVLAAAAERFGWTSRKDGDGRGSGLACGFDKGGYVATCAEVEVDKSSGRLRVVRAVTAFECGAIVNPAHLESQVEGGVIMGLGGALFEAVEFESGRILNASLSGYRVPRFSDVPRLETVLVERKDIPSAGAGETPIVAIAPAIGDAVFAAAGVRLRSMPLAPRGVEIPKAEKPGEGG